MSENRRQRIEAYEQEVKNENRKRDREGDQETSQKNISKAPVKFFYHNMSVGKSKKNKPANVVVWQDRKIQLII